LPVRFANPQQRRFYLLMRAFKIGNIVGTVVVVLYIGKHFFGG
jgi:hypothetical protein